MTTIERGEAPALPSDAEDVWTTGRGRSRLMRHPRRYGVALAFIASLGVNAFFAFVGALPTFTYGDSLGYWSTVPSFFVNGQFDFSDFRLSTFGYFYPLFDVMVSELSTATGIDPYTLFRLIDMLTLSTIGVLLVPRVLRAIWPEVELNAPRRLVLAAIISFFWRGLLDVNVTDAPGLVALLLFIVLLTGKPRAIAWLGAGIAGGILINLRPLDILVLVPVLVIVGKQTIKVARNDGRWRAAVVRRSLPHTALCVLALVVGLLLVSAPESLSNHEYYATWNPIPGTPAKIDVTELNLGLGYDRYDSTILNNRSTVIWYPDPSTSALQQALPQRGVNGYGQYLSVVIHHPLTMLASYARKLVLGLDLHYAQIYAPTITSSPNLRDLASCTAVFLAALRLLGSRLRGRLRATRWVPLVMLTVPALASLAFATEPRFLVPEDLLIFGLLVLPGWRDEYRAFAGRFARARLLPLFLICAAYVLWMAGWFAIVGNALSTAHT